MLTEGPVSPVGLANRQTSEEISVPEWGEDCWARVCSWFREYNLQRSKNRQGGRTEEEDVKQQQRMKTMTDMMKGRMDANHIWWIGDLLPADCNKAWIHPEREDAVQQWYSWLHEMKQ